MIIQLQVTAECQVGVEWIWSSYIHGICIPLESTSLFIDMIVPEYNSINMNYYVQIGVLFGKLG